MLESEVLSYKTLLLSDKTLLLSSCVTEGARPKDIKKRSCWRLVSSIAIAPSEGSAGLTRSRVRMPIYVYIGICVYIYTHAYMYVCMHTLHRYAHQRKGEGRRRGTGG